MDQILFSYLNGQFNQMVELIDENGPNLTFPDFYAFLQEEYEFDLVQRQKIYVEMSVIYHRKKAR